VFLGYYSEVGAKITCVYDYPLHGSGSKCSTDLTDPANDDFAFFFIYHRSDVELNA
jgi:hypothetical protein